MALATIFRIARWGSVLFVVMAGIAIFLYPGGTRRNPSTHGYQFFHQFGSDLGMSRAWNGQSNLLGASLFIVGELALVAAFGALVVGILSIAMSGQSRVLPRAAGAAGIVTVLGFVTTAFTSPDRLPALHVQSAVLAFRAACVASLLVTTVMIRDPRFTRRSAVTAAGMALLLIAFVGVTTWGLALRRTKGWCFR